MRVRSIYGLPRNVEALSLSSYPNGYEDFIDMAMIFEYIFKKTALMWRGATCLSRAMANRALFSSGKTVECDCFPYRTAICGGRIQGVDFFQK